MANYRDIHEIRDRGPIIAQAIPRDAMVGELYVTVIGLFQALADSFLVAGGADPEGVNLLLQFSAGVTQGSIPFEKRVTAEDVERIFASLSATQKERIN